MRIENPGYRHILIQGTRNPIHFYSFVLEYPLSESQCEIVDTQNVTIFGLKAEGAARVIDVKNSQDLCIFGYSGLASAKPGTSLMVFDGCHDFMVTNVVPRFFQAKGAKFEKGFIQHYDADKWFAILENTRGAAFKTKVFERPVLYKNGKLNYIGKMQD